MNWGFSCFGGTLHSSAVLFLRTLLELQKKSLSNPPHFQYQTFHEIPGYLCYDLESFLFCFGFLVSACNC